MVLGRLDEREGVIAAARQSLLRGGSALEAVPALLKRIMEEEMWREYRDERGTPHPFESFPQFLASPDGLNVRDIDTLRALCSKHQDVRSLLDQNLQRPSSLHAVDNINSRRPAGTAAEQALRRLREQRPDLHAAVLAGECSPHAAMIRAGFRRKTITVPIDAHRAAETLFRHFEFDDLELLVKELQEKLAVR